MTELRYFVMVKKEGKKRYSHTNAVYSTLAEAVEEAKKYSDSRVEGIDDNAKIIEKVIVNTPQ